MAAPGNVRDLLRQRLGVATTARSSAPVLFVTDSQALRNDPARVAFILVNIGGLTVHVAPAVDVGPSPFAGIRIDANGGALLVNWEQDGEMVGWEWRGLSFGGPAEMYLLENVIDQGRTPGEGAAGARA